MLVFSQVVHRENSADCEMFIEAKMGSGTSASSGDPREAWISRIKNLVSGGGAGGTAGPASPGASGVGETPVPKPRGASAHGNGASRRGQSMDAGSGFAPPTPVSRQSSLPAGVDGGGAAVRGGSRVGFTNFEKEPWFASGRTAHETAAELMRAEEGAFFVRESSTVANAYTLDIRTINPAEPVVSKRILKKGAFYMYEGDAYEHVSLIQCIAACSDYKVNLRTARPLPSRRPLMEESPRRTSGDALPAPPPASASRRLPPVPTNSKMVTINTRNIRSDAEMEDEIYGTVGPRDDVEEVDYSAMGPAEPVAPPAPPKPDVVPGAIREKNKLWKDRPDVVAQGLASKLSKDEIKRQEVIFEFVYSEEAYVKDIEGMLSIYIPRIRRSGLSFGEHPTFIAKFEKAVAALRDVCKRFLEALKQRQSESAVVERIADVLLDHIHTMAPKYFEYFEIVPDCKDILKRNTSGPLAELLATIRNDPSSRGLTMDSYSLVAVQRMMRYPMLIDEIKKKTLTNEKERVELDKACVFHL